jgi:hypothetical protein
MLVKYLRADNTSDASDAGFSFNMTDVYLLDTGLASSPADAEPKPSGSPVGAGSGPQAASVDQIDSIISPPHVSAGLHINLVADASVVNAPAAFAPAIRQAADIIEANFSDPITLNIRYGWGTYNNQAAPNLIGGNFAEGGDLGGQSVAYSTLRSWLTADASSTQDNTAVANLPSTVGNNFHVSTAQLKALGHFTGNANDVDGAIGWGTAWTSNFVGGALHELTHAMGRIFQDGLHYVMDLFRYDAAGHFQWTGRQPAYLSIDGGRTDLADFGVSTDFGDFRPGGVQGPDPFNESVSGNNNLTAVDITNMDVIGYNRASASPPPRTDDFANSLTDTTHPFGLLAANGTATGTLEVVGDHDWFRVQLVAGTSYVIKLEGQHAGAGTLDDPYLRVHNSAGAVVVENDDIALGTNRDSQLTYTPSTSGVFYIDAGAFNEQFTGTYRVSVAGTADDYANNLTDTTHPIGLVSVNGSATGALQVTGDRDWFRVQLIAGTNYLINLAGLNAGLGTLEDPYLRLHDSNGTLLAENDDIILGINRDSQLTFHAAATGTYYLEAGAFNDNYVGTYTVSVSGTAITDDFADNLTDTTAPFGHVAVGGSSTGNLETTGDRDWFQIQLAAGAAYSIDLQGQQAGVGTLEDPYLRVHDGTGALLAENDDIVLGVNRDSRLTFTPSAAGTYYLEAGAFADNYTGTYTVTVSSTIHVITGDNGDNTLIGTPNSDTISGLGGNDILLGGDQLTLTPHEASVFRLYEATLARVPDNAGLTSWAAALDAGTPLVNIAAGFVNSSEFQSHYGALDNTQFVTLLYNNVLGRAPDASGLAGWVATLNAGASRASVVIGFSESPEFQNNTLLPADAYATTDLHGATYGQVYRLYGASLHREPDTAGFEGWDDALAGGQSLVTIAAGFVNSPEFQSTYGALNNTQYVTLLYNNVLGRAPDAAGLNGWVGALNAGASRASVLVGFSDSPEYQNNTAAGLQHFMQHNVPDWADTLDGGTGINQLLGGRGPDLLVFNANDHATDKVYGVETWDQLQFTNFGYTATSQPLTRMTQSGHDVVFADQGTTVIFQQTDLATLNHLNYLI